MTPSRAALLVLAGLLASPEVARADDELPPLPPPAPPPEKVEGPLPNSTPIPPDPGKKLRLSGRAEAGPYYRRFIRVPVTGAFGSLGLGGQNDHIAVYGAFNFTFGSTEFGLRHRELQASGIFEWRAVPYLRLGATVDFDLLFVSRATTTQYMRAVGVGLGLLLAVEPVRWGERNDGGLFFGGKFGVSVFGGRDSGGTPIEFGPQATAGVRF